MDVKTAYSPWQLHRVRLISQPTGVNGLLFFPTFLSKRLQNDRKLECVCADIWTYTHTHAHYRVNHHIHNIHTYIHIRRTSDGHEEQNTNIQIVKLLTAGKHAVLSYSDTCAYWPSFQHGLPMLWCIPTQQRPSIVLMPLCSRVLVGPSQIPHRLYKNLKATITLRPAQAMKGTHTEMHGSLGDKTWPAPRMTKFLPVPARQG